MSKWNTRTYGEAQDARRWGYDAAVEGRSVHDDHKDDPAYLDGFREGLAKRLEWAQKELQGFDVNYPQVLKNREFLPEDLREKVKERLAKQRLDCQFGDGMEMEYIYEGCGMTGLNEMSDDELIDEYESDIAGDDQDEDDQESDDDLLIELRSYTAGRAIHEAIKREDGE